LRLHTTPKYTTTVTGHGNIKSYLYKYKIIDNPMCPCKKVTKQCNAFNLTATPRERKGKNKAVVTNTEIWQVNCNKIVTHYYEHFKEYIDKISWNIE